MTINNGRIVATIDKTMILLDIIKLSGDSASPFSLCQVYRKHDSENGKIVT
jgi:hypothetical protein